MVESRNSRHFASLANSYNNNLIPRHSTPSPPPLLRVSPRAQEEVGGGILANVRLMQMPSPPSNTGETLEASLAFFSVHAFNSRRTQTTSISINAGNAYSKCCRLLLGFPKKQKKRLSQQTCWSWYVLDPISPSFFLFSPFNCTFRP